MTLRAIAHLLTFENGHLLPFLVTLASEPLGLDIPDVVRHGPRLSCEKLDARDGDKAVPMLSSSTTLCASTDLLQNCMSRKIQGDT